MATELRCERRFISTTARRLDSLGALTRGQRQTGGENLFDPADNLESRYTKDALVSCYQLLFAGKFGSISLDGFQVLTRLKMEGEDGGLAMICRRSSAGRTGCSLCASPRKTRSSMSFLG